MHGSARADSASMRDGRHCHQAATHKEDPMAYSSILGAETAPAQPSGRDADALGPSDNSDSGSDAAHTSESHADSDAVGTGERGSVTPGEAREGADILPDRVLSASEEERALATGEKFPAQDTDAREYTDLDAKDVEDNAEGDIDSA
jgi:hypothetical protein